jgi:hypothetical protein
VLSETDKDPKRPIIGWLCQVSALPLTPCPKLETYRPRSLYVADNLPAAIGSSGSAIDLRLLSGHLDDPDEISPVVSKVLKALSDSDQLKATNPRLLLGGHGFGKSKSLFEIARYRYMILFDWAGKDQHIINLKEDINKLVLNRHKQEVLLFWF